MWPFTRRTEDRAYTDAIVNAIQSNAGKAVEDAGATSGLEIAAGVIARAFASAEISGPSSFTAPGPAILEAIGRDLIANGESLVTRDGGAWVRSSTWDVEGRGGDELAWRYRAEFPAPSGNYFRMLNGSSVVHVRYSTDGNRPWVGVGPTERAKLAATLHTNMELRTGEEAGSQTGHLLPLPKDGRDKTVEKLKATLGTLKGKTAFVESTASGWGQGKAAAPQADWRPQRIGATFSQATEPMFRQAQLAVVASCGVPVELLTAADGTGQREAWRRCLHGTIVPLGNLVEEQLSKVAFGRVSLSFESLMASDIAGRARAFQSMVGGGMSIDAAAASAGLLMED